MTERQTDSLNKDDQENFLPGVPELSSLQELLSFRQGWLVAYDVAECIEELTLDRIHDDTPRLSEENSAIWDVIKDAACWDMAVQNAAESLGTDSARQLADDFKQLSFTRNAIERKFPDKDAAALLKTVIEEQTAIASAESTAREKHRIEHVKEVARKTLRMVDLSTKMVAEYSARSLHELAEKQRVIEQLRDGPQCDEEYALAASIGSDVMRLAAAA